MAGLKTQETDRSVSEFVASIESPSKQSDAQTLISMMEEVTGFPPKIWGDNFIIGFGKYKYKRKSGKEEYEWFNMGFAPRKSKITVYMTCDLSQHQDLLMDQLGKFKNGAGCLYINKLADVDLEVLKQLMERNKGPL